MAEATQNVDGAGGDAEVTASDLTTEQMVPSIHTNMATKDRQEEILKIAKKGLSVQIKQQDAKTMKVAQKHLEEKGYLTSSELHGK